MDKLIKQLNDFDKSLRRLKEALDIASENKNNRLFIFLRDSSIQRFEFTFEIFWKMTKSALLYFEGVECNSPKSCMRELFRNQYINEEEANKLIQMIDDRNLTSHTYNEEVADILFQKLETYIELMKNVEDAIRQKMSNL